MAKFQQSDFLTIQEIQQFYRISPSTVRRWLKRPPAAGLPKLEAYRPGKIIFIDRKAFEQYIRKFPVSA